MIVYDVSHRPAAAAVRLLALLSGGVIRYRGTWLVKPGEPVWRWQA